MITNGTATPENYYRVKFVEMPYDVYAYGTSPLEAIESARVDIMTDALDITPLGGATVRRAVYKEWNYGTDRFTNGGDFIR